MATNLLRYFRGLALSMLTLALTLGGVVPAVVAGGPATLVQAFDPTPNAPSFSARGRYLEAGGAVFFAAWDSARGDELWKSDGTPGGTVLAAEIVPGDAGSNPAPLVALGATLLFAAADGSRGVELWASDGTQAGTRLVKDIYPGAGSSNPSGPFSATNQYSPTSGESPMVAGGRAYFVAEDGAHGNELWVSDGTTAGTQLVKDLTPGAVGSVIYAMADLAGTLYFTAGSQHGDVLWKTNGTAAGTAKVADIPFSAPIVSLGGKLVIFGFNAANSHGQIWTSDGTAAGTKLVKELPDQVSARGWASRPTILDGKVYFQYNTTSGVPGLWSTDGTAAGTTTLVQQMYVSALTEVDGKLFFIGSDGGFKLYVSDGTAARTTALLELDDFYTLAEGGDVGGRYVFIFCSDTCRVWSSDGTAGGTVPLTDVRQQISAPVATTLGGFFTICRAKPSGEPSECSVVRTNGTSGGTLALKAGRIPTPRAMRHPQRVGRRVFFTDGPTDSELWVSDGTAAGTLRVLALPDDAFFEQFAVVGNLLYAVVVNVDYTRPLWRSDGTAAGTFRVSPERSWITSLTPRGSTLFFLANGGDFWKSDGTVAGTVPIVYPNNPSLLTNLNGTLIFVGGVSQVNYLWRSDGTAAGSTGYAEPPFSINSVKGRFVVGGRLIYVACGYDGSDPCSLFVTDGTAAGTGKVFDFDIRMCYGKAGCDPDTLTDPLVVGDALYFAARDGGVWGLWKSDGTTEGTALVKAVRPSLLTAANGRLFFAADDGAHGAELWTSDGTTEGTRLVSDIRPGSLGSAPANLTPSGDGVFFSADDGSHGRELWAASATGARLLRDIRPGAVGSEPAEMADVDGQLYLSADDGSHGRELWVSDDEGTRLAQDIAEGARGSGPGTLLRVGARLLFSADDGVHGAALWSLPLSSRPFRPEALGARITIQAEDYDRGGEGLAYHDADALNHRNVYRTADGVDITTTRADGTGGYQVGWAVAGEWLNYTVDASTTRAYSLTLAVASQGSGGTLHLELDGQDVTGPLALPDTGGWYSWRLVAGPPVTLPAGRHTLRLVLDTAGPTGYVANFDWVRLDAATSRAHLPVVGR